MAIYTSFGRGGRKAPAPYIPGGPREAASRIRSDLQGPSPGDDERGRENRRVQYLQMLMSSAAPKTTEDIRGLADLAGELAGGGAGVSQKPSPGARVPLSANPPGTTYTARPGGIVVPTTRAVQRGAIPAPVLGLSEWGKQEVARRAILAERTRARAAEVASRPRQYGTIRTPAGVVIPEEKFERAMNEKRFPLDRGARGALEDRTQAINTRLAEIYPRLREIGNAERGKQPFDAQEQTRLRDEADALMRERQAVQPGAPQQRASESPTWRAFEYETQTAPTMRQKEQVDADLAKARQEYQDIQSGKAWEQARQEFRDSTDMRTQEAAREKLRALKGPQAKQAAWDRLVALARESKSLAGQVAGGPQAPSATELGTEQAEYQTGARRRATDVFPAEREAMNRAAQTAEDKYRSEAAAAEAARTEPTPFPAKPVPLPPVRQPTLDEARRQEVWERNKGVPFKDWSEGDRVGFGLAKVERNSTKERALQRIVDSLLTPPYQDEAGDAYKQRVERAARVLKALDKDLYAEIIGSGVVATGAETGEEVGPGIVERILRFLGFGKKASIAPALPTAESAPEEQTEGTAEESSGVGQGTVAGTSSSGTGRPVVEGQPDETDSTIDDLISQGLSDEEIEAKLRKWGQ